MQACSLGPRGKSEPNSVEREDPTLVTWSGPADPTNPLNWPQRKKWAVTILVSLGGMATMTSSTMIAPALSSISRDLHTDDATTQLTLSIFVLSYAFGPMVLAPLSEVYGRKPVWLLSCCLYVLWNTVCGFSKNTGVMIAGRFFSGLGGSAQYAVGSFHAKYCPLFRLCSVSLTRSNPHQIELPVLADIWPKTQRGRSFAIATFLPLLGPALGPILGGLLTASPRLGGWRGIFWALSIFDATLIATALPFFPETRAGTILARKAKRLRRHNPEYYTEDEINNDISPARILGTSLLRPCKLLLTEPVLQLAALYLAYNYGVLYIVHSTFANLSITHYSQSISTSGLHYIAMAVGCLVGAQVGGYLMDRYPESRIPVMIPGAVLLPAGLFLYGWTAEYRVFWVVPDLGIAIFSCGIILGTQSMQALVMDAYPEHVASATAGSQFPRNLTGFLFPLFAPRMYETLGYGWGTSLLAFLFLVIGIPVPLVLWKYGERLRRTS